MFLAVAEMSTALGSGTSMEAKGLERAPVGSCFSD